MNSLENIAGYCKNNLVPDSHELGEKRINLTKNPWKVGI